MTNIKRARMKAKQIEANADSFLDKLKESPITAVILSVVGLLAVYGLIKLVL
jgi:hypothetical protein